MHKNPAEAAEEGIPEGHGVYRVVVGSEYRYVVAKTPAQASQKAAPAERIKDRELVLAMSAAMAAKAKSSMKEEG